MINGVEIKQLRTIKDDRGWLMEMLRSDDKIFTKFGQCYITMCLNGVAKGWHYHKLQSDNFTCVFGKALLVMYDDRNDSETKGEIMEVVLEDPSMENPLLVKIPPFVLHGFTSLTEQARIVNVPDLPYNRESPDEYRFQWNDPSIPYQWKGVTKGG